MRKHPVFLLVLTALLSLSIILIPSASSQPENIKVLSYSWYIDFNGWFVVVGEVQNVGPNTISNVTLSGTVYTTDGTPQAYSGALVYVTYLVPQQKAPFYMEFPPSSSATGDLSWLSLGVNHVDFAIDQAPATTSYQYSDLSITDKSGTVSVDGVYWVTGTIRNTGNQTAKNIQVIATFYNSTGAAVAIGPMAAITPTSLAPSTTASFKVGAWDLNQTEVPSNLKISSYSLLIQVEEPILSGTPSSPSSSDNPTPTNSSSPTSPSDSTPSGSQTPDIIYPIIVVAVVLGIAGTALLLRKRKSEATRKRKAQVTGKPKRRKK